MPDFFLTCVDRVREAFIADNLLSSQDFPFLERYYARHWPALRKLEVGERKDVYRSGHTGDHRFNSNVRAYLGVLDEMSWGFKGTGPHTLALNILYTYTGDEKFSREYAFDFRADFLENINSKKSYVLEKSLILDWIKEKPKGITYVQ